MGTIEQIRPLASSVAKEEGREPLPVEEIRHATDRVRVKNADGRVVQTILVEEYFPPKDRLVSEIPVLVAPGFTVGPETLRPSLTGLAQEGLHALTYDAPQGVPEESVPFSRLQNLRERGIDTHEQRKAAALLEVIAQKNFSTRIDAIGHSEGAIYLVLAALEEPERFRTLLLENPGGMVGDDGFFALIGRAYEHRRQEIEEAKNDPVIRDILSRGKGERRWNFAVDVARGIQSARAIACTQIQELLFLLKKKDIHIIIAHAVDDLIFPMDEVQKISRTMRDESGNLIPGREFIDGFYSIRGGHNDFIVNPRMHAILAADAFGSITKKEARDSSVETGARMAA